MLAVRSSMVVGCLLVSAAFAVAEEPSGPFRIRSAISTKGVQTFRWNKQTGAASKLELDTWYRIHETDKPAPGDYDLVLVAANDSWMIYRIETNTGTTWAAFMSAKPRELEWRQLKEKPPMDGVGRT